MCSSRQHERGDDKGSEGKGGHGAHGGDAADREHIDVEAEDFKEDQEASKWLFPIRSRRTQQEATVPSVSMVKNIKKRHCPGPNEKEVQGLP